MSNRSAAAWLAIAAAAVFLVVAVIAATRPSDNSAAARPSAAARASAAELATPTIAASATATPAAPSLTEGTAATGSPAATAPEPEPAFLVAAGDIADCGSEGDEATAALLDVLPGTVAALGDLVYPSGRPEEFASCYGPSWGRHAGRTRPAPGNHDYETLGAAGYYSYFGAAAGPPGQGWHSYDLGEWHVIVLNSICGAVGGCHAGSPQEQWLRADLAANPAACTLAYWHNPRFSSAQHGSDAAYQAFWQALHDAGADVVLSAHDHVYERFAPQTPSGELDEANGVRQFTVGTGGKSLYDFGAPLPTTEMRNNDTFGVLRLTLHPDRYDWEFVPASGGTFTDTGSDTCH